MSVNNLNESKVDERKVLIMGLDNSGKTSILLSLKQNTNLLTYFSLKPTNRISIEKMESRSESYFIWDFGGQEKFRNEYLEQFESFIGGAEKIIFVIDVQDEDRYEIALDYLADIVKGLKNHDMKVKFSVFLHKYDPQIETRDKLIDKKIRVKLIKKIKNIMGAEFECQIFRTSIYTVFEKIYLA